MREINLRAEYILLKFKSELKREGLLSRVTAIGIFVCAGVLLSAFYGNIFLALPSAAGGILLLYFYFAQRLYLSERFAFLAGEREALRTVRISRVLRFALFKLYAGTVRFLWLNFFLLPSRITAVIIIRTLYMTGNIQRVMLITLVFATLILCAVGLIFYFYMSGRYFLSELLFVRCPKQKPSELLKSSALLTKGRLTEIMLFRIRNTFFAGGVKRKMRCALSAFDVFSDRKFCKSYGLVSPFTFREHV